MDRIGFRSVVIGQDYLGYLVPLELVVKFGGIERNLVILVGDGGFEGVGVIQ